MADLDAPRLRRLAAEVLAELERVDQTHAELGLALARLRDAEVERLVLYGSAALLETFYTGIEKTFMRIASATGDVPTGPSWHRELLEAMTLEIPKLRPAAVSTAAVPDLEELLAFRHRFRNLYLFELRPTLVAGLVERALGAWPAVRRDLESFAAAVAAVADALEAD